MASTTDIINGALARLGEERIVSIDDKSGRGQTIRDVWNETRQALLRSHTWNFAVRTHRIAALATTPAFGWTYLFDKPAASSDRGPWLRTISVTEDGDKNYPIAYQDQGRRIAANVNPIYLHAIYDVTDPLGMDPLFRQALSLQLAADLAISLTHSNVLHEKMQALADRALLRARAVDARDDGPPKPAALGSWELERFGGAYPRLIGETPD